MACHWTKTCVVSHSEFEFFLWKHCGKHGTEWEWQIIRSGGQRVYAPVVEWNHAESHGSGARYHAKNGSRYSAKGTLADIEKDLAKTFSTESL